MSLIVEGIISFVTFLSNIAIFITMLYGIKQFRQNKMSVQANLDRQTKSETITFTNEILEKTDKLFYEIKKRFGDDTINVSDLLKEEDSELNTAITQYLSLMERLSVGLNTHVYDLDIYARICCSKTIKAWKQLENVINEKRKSSSNSNSLYIEFEKVVKDLRVWREMPQETRGNYEGLK